MTQQVSFSPYSTQATPLPKGIRSVPLFTTVEPQLFAGKLREAQLDVREQLGKATAAPYLTDDEKYLQQRYEHYSKYISLDKVDSMSQLMQLTADIDYTGMSDIEKYMAIYDRYAQTFGENFLMAGAIQYASNTDTARATDIYGSVTVRFYDDLRAVFGSAEKAKQVYKEHIYENMSDSEIRAEIAAKYPPASRMTLEDFCFFVSEMNQFGVAGGLEKMWMDDLFVDKMRSGGIDVHGMNIIHLRDEFFNSRFDVGALCRLYNSMLMAGSMTAETGLLLQGLFGVSLDGNGYAWA